MTVTRVPPMTHFVLEENVSPALLESGEHEQLFFSPPNASFIQLNPNVNAFQRKFVGEVRRCEELEKTFCECFELFRVTFILTWFVFSLAPPLTWSVCYQPSWSRRSIAPCLHPCSSHLAPRARHLWPLSPASSSPSRRRARG